jgi:hypothetical protein
MIQKYGKNIIPIRDNSKDGFEVLDNNSEKTDIRLSEIVSFFKDIDTSNEISTLNIVDLTCRVISEGTEEYYTRLSRRLSRGAHYGADSANIKKFGGKKINLRYLPRRLTRKDKKKQINMLLKSRRLYKKGDYYTRKKVKSFQQCQIYYNEGRRSVYAKKLKSALLRCAIIFLVCPSISSKASTDSSPSLIRYAGTICAATMNIGPTPEL